MNKFQLVIASLVVIPFLANCGSGQKDVIYHNISFRGTNCAMYDDKGAQIKDMNFEEGQVAHFTLRSDDGYKSLDKDQVKFTTDGTTPFKGECSFDESYGSISVTMTEDVVVVANATKNSFKVLLDSSITKYVTLTNYEISTESIYETYINLTEEATKDNKVLPADKDSVHITSEKGEISNFNYAPPGEDENARLWIPITETSKITSNITIAIDLDTAYKVTITSSDTTEGKLTINPSRILVGKEYSSEIVLSDDTKALPEDGKDVTIAFGEQSIKSFKYTRNPNDESIATLTIGTDETAVITGDVTITVTLAEASMLTVSITNSEDETGQLLINGRKSGRISTESAYNATITLGEVYSWFFELPDDDTNNQVVVIQGSSTSVLFTYTYVESDTAELSISAEETAKITQHVTIKVKVYHRYDIKMKASDSSVSPYLFTIEPNQITAGKKFNNAKITLKDVTKSLPEKADDGNITIKDEAGYEIKSFTYNRDKNNERMAYLTIEENETAHIESEVTVTVKLGESPSTQLNVSVKATDSQYDAYLTLDKEKITIGEDYEVTITLDESQFPTKGFGPDGTHECVTVMDSMGNKINRNFSTLGDNVLTVGIPTYFQYEIQGDLTIIVNIIDRIP